MVGALNQPVGALQGEPLDEFTTMVLILKFENGYSYVTRIIVIRDLTKTNHLCK